MPKNTLEFQLKITRGGREGEGEGGGGWGGGRDFGLRTGFPPSYSILEEKKTGNDFNSYVKIFTLIVAHGIFSFETNLRQEPAPA